MKTPNRHKQRGLFGIDDLTTGALFSGASSLLGGLFGFEGQKDTNAQNQANVQAQMDFQERMSNTAYQRATKDMESAGLNPMLAYSQGGASTPLGGAATFSNPAAAASQSAMQAASGNQAIAQIDATRASAEAARAAADKSTAEAELTRKQTPGYQGEQDARVANIRQQTDSLVQKANLDNASTTLVKEQVENAIKEGKRIEANTGNIKADTVLKELQVNQAKAYSNYYATPAGKDKPRTDWEAHPLTAISGSIADAMAPTRGSSSAFSRWADSFKGTTFRDYYKGSNK